MEGKADKDARIIIGGGITRLSILRAMLFLSFEGIACTRLVNHVFIFRSASKELGRAST